jgi:hypothetical protein
MGPSPRPLVDLCQVIGRRFMEAPAHNNQVPPPLAALAPEDMAPYHVRWVTGAGGSGRIARSSGIRGGPRRHPKNVMCHRRREWFC